MGFLMPSNDASGQTDSRILVEVSPDRLRASMKLTVREGEARPTLDELAGAVNDAELPVNDEMLARLTAIIEDFPEDIPEFSRESCNKGWEYFIQNRLKVFLDSCASGI